MAIITRGPFLGFVGTINGMTFYTDKWGRTIAKSQNKPRSVPASEQQDMVMEDTVRIASFMQPLKQFVHVGYRLEAEIKHLNPYNAMVTYVRRNALTGTGTARRVDYSKVLMTKGEMTPALNAVVLNFQTGLMFKWDTTEADSSMHWTDQVILLAYFPALSEVRYLSAGPERRSGEAYLELDGTRHGSALEVYISFVSSNRRAISDSIYLGQLNW